MPRLGNFVWVLGGLLHGAMALAGEEEHRHTVQRLLLVAHADPTVLRYPVLSDLYAGKEHGSFTQSSGRSFLSVPDVAYSAYDASISHHIAKFYTPRTARLRWVLNYMEPRTQWLLSVGHDSGMQADKLSISQSSFLGVAKRLDISPTQILNMSWGQWFGGKVTERPCLDEYDRQYWCPNLSAWVDRPTLDTQPGKYYELKYQWQFD